MTTKPPRPRHADVAADPRRLSRATQPLVGLLRQLADVIARLHDAQYTQTPVGAMAGSVGGHVRHCLDHVRLLLVSVKTGHLDYDDRQRNTPVECSRCCALSEIDELVAHLLHLPVDTMDRPVRLRALLNSTDEPVEVETSVGRELAFVLSHTIHHDALIGAMVRTLGGWLPEQFGYAPSTIKHLEASECVR